MEKGDSQWEADLLASFRILSQTEKSIKVDSMEHYLVWEKYHYAFNRALLATCPLKHLLKIQEKNVANGALPADLVPGRLKEKRKTRFFVASEKNYGSGARRKKKTAVKLLEEHYEKALNLMLNDFF